MDVISPQENKVAAYIRQKAGPGVIPAPARKNHVRDARMGISGKPARRRPPEEKEVVLPLYSLERLFSL